MHEIRREGRHLHSSLRDPPLRGRPQSTRHCEHVIRISLGFPVFHVQHIPLRINWIAALTPEPSTTGFLARFSSALNLRAAQPRAPGCLVRPRPPPAALALGEQHPIASNSLARPRGRLLGPRFKSRRRHSRLSSSSSSSNRSMQTCLMRQRSILWVQFLLLLRPLIRRDRTAMTPAPSSRRRSLNTSSGRDRLMELVRLRVNSPGLLLSCTRILSSSRSNRTARHHV